MKRAYLLLMALTLAVAMILPLGVVNAASPQEEVSGYLVLATTGFIPKAVGTDNLMKGEIDHYATYTGSISGGGGEIAHFTYNLTSLALASNGVQEFNGAVLGKSGTLTFAVHHLGAVALGVLGEVINVEQTIISGTGDLANLRGTLHFTVEFTGGGVYEGAYSGKLHFAR